MIYTSSSLSSSLIPSRESAFSENGSKNREIVYPIQVISPKHLLKRLNQRVCHIRGDVFLICFQSPFSLDLLTCYAIDRNPFQKLLYLSSRSFRNWTFVDQAQGCTHPIA